jgi:hypothetical protein
MNIMDAYPGAYLKASDLKDRPVNVAMHSVSIEDIGGESKPVLYFQDAHGRRRDRGLVLNKTNASIIADMFGPETDAWPGRVVTIYAARVEFGGKIVDGIRIRLEQPAASAVQAPLTAPAAAPAQNGYAAARNGASVAAPAARSQIDDEIPF